MYCFPCPLSEKSVVHIWLMVRDARLVLGSHYNQSGEDRQSRTANLSGAGDDSRMFTTERFHGYVSSVGTSWWFAVHIADPKVPA